MNLSDIYQRVFDLADWNPSSSPEAKARVIRFINMSYFQMALDAPYLFFEGMVDMATEPDVDRSNRSDTLSVFTNGSDADPWVLKRNLPTTHHTSPTLWKVDGTWNGRKIQVQDSEGDWHIHTIRDVWTDSTYQYVSLLRPFTDTTQTEMRYKIFTDYYYLPPEVMRVNHARTVDGSIHSNWEPISQTEAEEYYLPTNPTDSAVSGYPTQYFRRPPGSLPAPNWTPVAEQSNSWAGPEPEGTFEYKITYVWGKQDVELGSPGPLAQTSGMASGPGTNRLKPRLESPPSPVSNQQSTGDSSAPSAINVSLPDIDFMQGFAEDAADLARGGHSGWTKRIYRRRLTSITPAVSVDHMPSYSNNIETSDTFYLLTEVSGSKSFFLDDGELTPDFLSPLRESNLHEAIQIHPRPNSRIRFELRCLMRPTKLVSDTDAPLLKVDGIPALIEAVIAKVLRAEGNGAEATVCEGRYEDWLTRLAKRYDSLRPASKPTRRLACSPRRGHRAYARNWKNDL